ncbi:transglutaminase-like domain-containing protein [Rubinisphaera margarita]|uniref:transglutaminase-like domain-containing protein n=1 Tax=Rubinisphaera margarita TaxID=2909586 RepID=UPI001EE79900|nr:transglutaminase-like domain-containing protein [Rubinisphaera margarita]MCG6156596.1 transglutaminase-like domain-containing protein [Rubinisphaera margarita]
MRRPDTSSTSADFGYWLTCGLVAIAHLATEIVVGEPHGQITSIVIRFVLIGLLVAGFCWQSIRRQWQPSSATTLMALLVMGLPPVIEPFWRWSFQNGHAFEIQLLIGFRNLSLLGVVFAHVPRFERLAVFTSLFSVLFCISTSQDASMAWICGLYLLTGVTWLSTTYWSVLRTDRISGSISVAPWWIMAAASVLLLAVLFTIALPTSVRLRMVEGFMPSSGGTGSADANARSGVGDGDALVAATQEALTFAPIEDAPFLESDQPSLYDVFQDTYSPPKPPSRFERAVSLPPDLFKQNHHRMAQARKASRSFSLDREQTQKKEHRHLKDTASDALLHLVGPVPAHLRHTVYDLFDGTEWYPAEKRTLHERALKVEQHGDKPWITWSDRPYPILNVRAERHALRILKVDTNRVLAPANLNGVHIDRCDRADLFEWAQEDVLAMERSSLPPMSVIHVVSTRLDSDELSRSRTMLGFGLEEYRTIPEGPGMREIQAAAREWTRGTTCGWDKVCAICDRLRTEYRLNPDVRVPDGCENPVHWFLTESQEGPDYLFATACVMLCRSIGITSRAVSGLYAGPNQFDFSTQQTSVRAEDAHWWAEVYVGSQAWVTVEPTPGYAVRDFPRGFLAQAGLWTYQLGRLAMIYWPLTLFSIGAAATGVRQRCSILTRCQTWWWDWKYREAAASSAQLRSMLLDAGRLLDRKLTLTGTPRPASQTLATFVTQLQDSEHVSADVSGLLKRAFEWAAYSESDPSPVGLPASRIREICRSMLHRRRTNRDEGNLQPSTGTNL